MVTPAAGAVVLVPFPFSDLSQAKLRPAAVLADAGRGDWILCQITSKPYADPQAITLVNASFATGSLHLTSYARPGKLFTANRNLMVAELQSMLRARRALTCHRRRAGELGRSAEKLQAEPSHGRLLE